MAVRTFVECANSPDHQFGRYPADYTLFEVGEFDDEDAHIEIYGTKKNLGNGLEHQRPADLAIPGQQDLLDTIPTNGL